MVFYELYHLIAVCEPLAEDSLVRCILLVAPDLSVLATAAEGVLINPKSTLQHFDRLLTPKPGSLRCTSDITLSTPTQVSPRDLAVRF